MFPQPMRMLLANWPVGFESMRTLDADPTADGFTEADVEMVEGFRDEYLQTVEINRTAVSEIPADVRLTDLTRNEHGEDRMEWGSEVLAFQVTRLDTYVGKTA